MEVTIDEIAGQCGRMVECAVMSGDKDKAYAAIDYAFDRQRVSSRPGMNDSIALVVSPRMATILEGAGVSTIGDLVSHSRDSLASIHQIRYRSVDLIERALSVYGYRLKRTAVHH